jgi:hypothetical protein
MSMFDCKAGKSARLAETLVQQLVLQATLITNIDSLGKPDEAAG